MASRLLKCPLCGEVVDVPEDDSAETPACPTCGGELAAPKELKTQRKKAARRAAKASKSDTPRPPAAPRPVSPGETAIASGSWGSDTGPSPLEDLPPRAAVASKIKRWAESPLILTIAGAVIFAIGVGLGMLMKGRN